MEKQRDTKIAKKNQKFGKMPQEREKSRFRATLRELKITSTPSRIVKKIFKKNFKKRKKF